MTNDGSTAHTPLAELHASQNTADFMRELARRFHAGGQDEVIAFVREVDLRVLGSWNSYRDAAAPWYSDTPLWLALVRVAAARGRFLPAHKPAFSAALSQEMQALAQAVLAQPEHFALSELSAARFVHDELSELFWFEEMPPQQAIALLDRGLALGRQYELNLLLDTPEGTPGDVVELQMSGWPALYASLSAEDLLALAERHRISCRALFAAYRTRVQHLPAATRWSAWQLFFTRYPEVFLPNARVIADPDLAEFCWRTHSSRALAAHMLDLLRSKNVETTSAYAAFDRMARSAPQPFLKQFDRDPSTLTPALARHLLAARHDELLAGLFKVVTPMIDKIFNSYRDVLRRSLAAIPALLRAVDAAGVARLLPLLDTGASSAVLRELAEVAKAKNAKTLRSALAQWCQQLPLAELVNAGWLDKPNRNLSLALLDIVLAHPDTATAAALLQKMADGNLLDAASLSVAQAHLQVTGLTTRTSPAAPVSLDQLEAKATGVKRLSAAIRRFDEAPLLALFAPLSTHAARVVLHLAATSDDEAPPLLGELLSVVAGTQLAELAIVIARSWIAAEGDPKLAWCLQLIGPHTDERAADLLHDAAVAWGKDKNKRQRATAAARRLGLIDSSYALARVHQLGNSDRVKPAVAKAARQVFVQAAGRRGLATAELHDELTLDFSAAATLTLQLGGALFRVELDDDHSLQLVDADGQRSKRLDVATSADPTQRAIATARFKALATRARLIAQQLPQRLEDAFRNGRSWALPRWRELFATHRIARTAARHVIWLADAGSAAQISFRISDEDTLLDAQGAAVQLSSDARISLWHPATARAGETQAWTQHFAAAALPALFDQTNAPSSLPQPAQLSRTGLQPSPRLARKPKPLLAALAACGYRAGWNDGLPADTWHDCFLPFEQLTLRVQHSYCVEWSDDAVEVQSLQVYANEDFDQPVDAATWSPPLQATLLGHLEQIRTIAEDALPPPPPASNVFGFLLVEFPFDGTASETFSTLAEALALANHEGTQQTDPYLIEVLQQQTPELREATEAILRKSWFWRFDSEIGWRFEHDRRIASLELEYRYPLTRAQVGELERWAKAGGALGIVAS